MDAPFWASAKKILLLVCPWNTARGAPTPVPLNPFKSVRLKQIPRRRILYRALDKEAPNQQTGGYYSFFPLDQLLVVTLLWLFPATSDAMRPGVLMTMPCKIILL